MNLQVDLRADLPKIFDILSLFIFNKEKKKEKAELLTPRK
jgi:hypothetical protein